MATDEEYLDNLLKSLSEGGKPEEMSEDETAISDDVELDSLDISVDNLLEKEPVTDKDLTSNNEPLENDLTEDTISIEDVLSEGNDLSVEEMLSEGNNLSVEDVLSEGNDLAVENILSEGNALSIGDVLSEESDLSVEDVLSEESELPIEDAFSEEDDLPVEEYLPVEESSISDESLADVAVEEEKQEESETGSENDGGTDEILDDPNLLQMLENMENSDPDLEEINSLLNKANLNESVDDDMLALLESVGENQDYQDESEAFDIFAESELGDLPDINMNARTDVNPESEDGAGKKKKKKKFDFFKKIMALLTKEADEPDYEQDAALKSDSNAEANPNAKLIEELDKGNKKKASKKEKKASKKDKKKAKSDVKEKKKLAKPKKIKEKKPQPIVEKPGKILNTKGLIAIVALCATLIASILILSMFLPQFASRQEARTAFQKGNYKTVYELFYKKKLSSKEAELYHKAKTVLRIERKLESYRNNMAMDRELEAVDALILGVKCYQGLREADTYGVRQEVDAVYQQICSILESNYGISEEEAISITKYDNVVYTRRLREIVGITSPEAEEMQSNTAEAEDDTPEDEEAEDITLFEDILPEEEDLMEQ